MADHHNSTNNSMIASHEDRLQRLEEQMGEVTAAVAARTVMQDTMLRRIDDMEGRLGKQVEFAVDRLVHKVDEIKSQVGVVTVQVDNNNARLSVIEDRRAGTERWKDVARKVVAALLIAAGGAGISYIISSFTGTPTEIKLKAE